MMTMAPRAVCEKLAQNRMASSKMRALCQTSAALSARLFNQLIRAPKIDSKLLKSNKDEIDLAHQTHTHTQAIIKMQTKLLLAILVIAVAVAVAVAEDPSDDAWSNYIAQRTTPVSYRTYDEYPNDYKISEGYNPHLPHTYDKGDYSSGYQYTTPGSVYENDPYDVWSNGGWGRR